MEGSDRAIWARFLDCAGGDLRCLAPLVLGLLCAGLAWRAGGKLALNTGESGYLRLQGDLMPEQTVSDNSWAPAGKARSQTAPAGTWQHWTAGPGSGSKCLALRRPDAPDFSEIEVLDLGSADRRSQRRELEDALAALRPPPSVLLVVCSLLRNPPMKAPKGGGAFAQQAGRCCSQCAGSGADRKSRIRASWR